ncbi:MAG: S8 family serine peptidase [Planctomycetaceae bacterium]|nr:S8 family serine peptidase [Planctomycetaceae bacterium]
MKSQSKHQISINQLWIETLEQRIVLASIAPHSFAFDLIDLYDMRRQPDFQEIDGQAIGIALIDTGVDGNHELLRDNYVTSLDLVYGQAGNYYSSNHGTHVAGIAASTDPNIGVATDADIISLQVFSESDGYSSWIDILESLQWVRENHHAYNIKVVNMSLGGGMFNTAASGAAVTQDVYQEILNLEHLGISVVSAAGNEYGFDRNGINFMSENANAPGIYSTIVVGAVWESYEGGGLCLGNYVCDVTTGADRIIHYSQRPPQHENVIFAPGAFINSTVPGDNLQEMGGTSMAAPMVSGAIALMQDAAMTFGGRYLSTSEVQTILRSSADTIHDGDDENSITTIDGIPFNYTDNDYPRLNILNAVEQVRALVEGNGEPTNRYQPNSGDPNSTFAGAYQGPELPLHWSVYDNNPEEAIILKGILGTDARRFEIGDSDVDMFSFEVTSAGIVILETSPWNANRDPADTVLRLFDHLGNQLAIDDNTAGNSFSHLEAALPAGQYYVGVSGSGNNIYDPNVSGSGQAADRGYYQLAFSWANDDLNGFLDTAVQVSFNQGQTQFDGLIGSDYGTYVGTQDVDLFRIVVPDDGAILVDIDTPDVDGYVDSYLRVFDGNGVEITYSDDNLQTDVFGYQVEYTDSAYPGLVFNDPVDRQYFDGHARDSFVLGDDLTQGQVLYFGVSGYGNGIYNPMSVDGRRNTVGGTYEVSFQFESKDLSGTIDQAMNLPDAGTWYEEFIYYDWDSATADWAVVSDKDIDFYGLTSPTSGVFEIDIDSYSITDNDDVLDSVITVFDHDGNYIAQRDWDFVTNGQWDAKIQFLSNADTTYYVAISGMGNQAFDPFMIGDALPGDMGYYQIKWDVYSDEAYNTLSDNRLGHGGILDVELGSYLTAEIGYDDAFALDAHDVDLYRFTPTQSGDYMTWTTLPDEWSADTVMRLFDSNGTELAFNDDDPTGGLGSYLSYSFTANETYYIGVSGFSEQGSVYDAVTGTGTTAGTMGDYTISLAHTDLPPTVDPLTNILVPEDSDSYHLQLNGLSSGVGESQEFQLRVFGSNTDVVTTLATHAPNAPAATIDFTFADNQFGTSAIVIELMDGGYDDNLATLIDNQYFIEEFSFTIDEINDTPIADSTQYALAENETLSPDLANDLYHLVTDPDVNQFNFDIVTAPQFGQLDLQLDGSFQYIPNENFNRADSFSYIVNDGNVDSNIGQVDIQMQTQYEWFNGALPGDTNDDGQLVPADALMLINELNSAGSATLAEHREGGMQAPFWDNSRDNQLSSIDVLVVINELNRLFAEGEQASIGEGETWVNSVEDYFTAEHITANELSGNTNKLDSATVDIDTTAVEIAFTNFGLITGASPSTQATLQREDVMQRTKTIDPTDIHECNKTAEVLS